MLSKIAKDDTLVGMLGRTVLARAFHFLLDWDKKWTKQTFFRGFTAAQTRLTSLLFGKVFYMDI